MWLLRLRQRLISICFCFFAVVQVKIMIPKFTKKNYICLQESQLKSQWPSLFALRKLPHVELFKQTSSSGPKPVACERPCRSCCEDKEVSWSGGAEPLHVKWSKKKTKRWGLTEWLQNQKLLRKVKAKLIQLIQLIKLNKLISCRSDFKGRAAMPHPDWSLSILFVWPLCDSPLTRLLHYPGGWPRPWPVAVSALRLSP